MLVHRQDAIVIMRW